MHNKPITQFYILIYILFNLLTIASVKAQPDAKDICGIYKPASSKPGERKFLLQLTYIEKDTYWIFYRGFLQAVKPVKQGLSWEFIPIQKTQNQLKLVYTGSIFTVQKDSIKISYEKFKLPALLDSLFDPAKTIKQQLYQISDHNQDSLTNNYTQFNSIFQVSFHDFKNASERCCPYFMILDINEPMIVRDAGVSVVFRAWTYEENDEFKNCKTPDISKSYTPEDDYKENAEGNLYLNEQGEVQALLIPGYMNAGIFANKNSPLEDVKKLMQALY